MNNSPGRLWQFLYHSRRPPLPTSSLPTWEILFTPKGDAPMILLWPRLLSTTSSHQIFSQGGRRSTHGQHRAFTHCLISLPYSLHVPPFTSILPLHTEATAILKEVLSTWNTSLRAPHPPNPPWVALSCLLQSHLSVLLHDRCFVD